MAPCRYPDLSKTRPLYIPPSLYSDLIPTSHNSEINPLFRPLIAPTSHIPDHIKPIKPTSQYSDRPILNSPNNAIAHMDKRVHIANCPVRPVTHGSNYRFHLSIIKQAADCFLVVCP